MNDKYLFLFGANPSLKEPNKEFIQKAGGRDARISLLILNREGWREYLPRYTDTWRRFGAEQYSVILPDHNGHMNYQEIIATLTESTGIFIGGGDTEKYHDYYANEPIKSLIKEQHNRGVPIAGSSAGALILPEISLISPNDTKNGKMISRNGIGLLTDILISVHFTEWNDEKNLVAGMLEHKIAHGIGIDEEACAVFRNGHFESAYGNAVHHIKITDFVSGSYEIIY